MDMYDFRSKRDFGTSKENSRDKVWNFISAPYLHPMKVNINRDKPGTASGLLFVAPYTIYEAAMIGQTGSLIMDKQGNPVWFRPLDNRYIQNCNFRVQYYKDKPVLTMWQGTISGTQSANPNLPLGDPEPGAYFQILNQNYEIIKKITAQRGFTADLHEFTITARNTALFTSVKQVPANLTRYGGPKEGFIDNCSIQEVDLETGKLLFFWDVLAHVNPANSITPASSASDNNNNIWDCFHVNSVQEGPNNNLLISMRNMWAIYNIDKDTGDIIWQLGGKRSDFTFGPKASFSWQHDARFVPGERISLFDNGCCASPDSPPESQSHGLILQLDFRNMTADVDRAYYHCPPLNVFTQGNIQKLYNGNRLVGWGQEPYLSEFAYEGNNSRHPSENFLYDLQFPNQIISYRAFKNKWIGLPLYPPSIAADLYCNYGVVYASWNGSTETCAWQVLAGTTPNSLRVVGSIAPRTGFETKIDVYSKGPYFQVNALNSCGRIIGKSRVIYVDKADEEE